MDKLSIPTRAEDGSMFFSSATICALNVHSWMHNVGFSFSCMNPVLSVQFLWEIRRTSEMEVHSLTLCLEDPSQLFFVKKR